MDIQNLICPLWATVETWWCNMAMEEDLLPPSQYKSLILSYLKHLSVDHTRMET